MAVEAVEKSAGEQKKTKTFKGDATKVVAKGNGLKKAFSGSAGNFTIDVKGAGQFGLVCCLDIEITSFYTGQGALYMGMVAQSGNPIAELSYKRARGTLYNCTFRAVEKGDATLTIRWGSDDIPGSPFAVKIA